MWLVSGSPSFLRLSTVPGSAWIPSCLSHPSRNPGYWKITLPRFLSGLEGRAPVSSWQPADLSSFNFKLIKQVPYVHHRFLLKPSPALGLTTWGRGNVPSLTFSEESLRTLWRAHCRTAHLSLPPSTTCHFHASLSTLRKPSPSPPLHQNSAL